MPSRDDHLRQAQHNLEFSASLDESTHSDWVATAIFYAALHYVDAFLATKNQHPGKHDVRDGFVAKLYELKPIHGNYRFLKDSSRNARYNPPTRYRPEQLQDLKQHLDEIRTHLRNYIPIP